MTTPLLHITGAFICLVFFDRFSKRTTPPEKLFVISLAAILPDILDKTLTGTRYPFHSILVSGFILLVLSLFVFFASSRGTLSFTKAQEYTILASIAFLSHIFLDLEGLVPLFFPLDLRGYRVEFRLEIIQSFLPLW